MKSKQTQQQHALAQAVRYLISPSGRKALRAVARRSEEAAKPFKKARDVNPANLHRRFTV
jgi:hypothetical protein